MHCLFLFMDTYKEHIRLLFLRIILLIFVFSFTRLIFHVFNASYFSVDSLFDALSIYFGGLKYDMVIIAIFNALFIFAHAIPGRFKQFDLTQNILKVYFILVNGILLSLNFIDTKYFDFTNKRSTIDLFQLMKTSEDVWELIPLFIKDYWYLILLWILLFLGLWFIYPQFKRNENRLENDKKNKFNLLAQAGIFILVMGLTFLGARGSIKLKPLRTINASEYTSSQNIPLVLNTPFTVLKSINKKELKQVNYFPGENVSKLFNPVQVFAPDSSFVHKNIVIIIMESFASEYIGAFNNGKGYTPYLDSLIQKSTVFPNAFANGKKSIEAVPSILLGIPSLMDNPYLTSSYATNKIESIATILSEKGYNSSFFHGGKNGTMGFDKFLNFAGFDAYYGMDEFPGENAFDGGWGIYDEPFFHFFADELDQINTPFVSCFFSLSSHHPYHIPDEYANTFSKGSLNIHESIGYADYALHSFFTYAQQYKWYENTLFIITADHTAQLETKKYNNSVGNYRIPIILYDPTDEHHTVDSTIVQQIDILPTILDYLNYDGKVILFGESVWNKNNPFTINFKNGIYQLIDEEYLLQFNGKDCIGMYAYPGDYALKNNLLHTGIKKQKILEKKLKVFIQVFNNRVIHNNLVLDE